MESLLPSIQGTLADKLQTESEPNSRPQLLGFCYYFSFIFSFLGVC